MKHVSIRWRMTLWNTTAFAVVLVGFGLLVYSLLRQTHYQQIDRVLDARYQELLADDRIAENPDERFPLWMRGSGTHVELLGIVRDPDGRIVGQDEPSQELSSQIVPPARLAGPQFDSLTLPGLGPMRRLSAMVPTTKGEYTLMLFAELEHVEEELGLVIKSLLITVPVTLVIAAVLAYLLAYKALAPVEQLLPDAVESLRPLANTKGQELVTEIECEAVAMADPEQLRTVLHNLIDNAIKYTPVAGRIVVTLACAGTDALVTVEDNGMGIPPKHVPHVFDRFYRVNKSSESDDGGAGLGLSIVQSIVSSLGGRVEVESTPGEGSKFRVYLPRVRDRETEWQAQN